MTTKLISPFRIILAAREPAVVKAWKEFCGDIENVTVHEGSILDLQVDAVVSPANSFGFMDGGIDMIYSRFFGWGVQKALQARIQSKHAGELLLGVAEIVPTQHKQIPYCIAAPTMRVPMILDQTPNPYLAARGVMLLLKNGTFDDEFGPQLAGTPIRDTVKSVAFPGLGTGVGRMPPHICARQVRQAIVDIACDQYTFPKSWDEAQARHQKLFSDGPVRDLQFEPGERHGL